MRNGKVNFLFHLVIFLYFLICYSLHQTKSTVFNLDVKRAIGFRLSGFSERKWKKWFVTRTNFWAVVEQNKTTRNDAKYTRLGHIERAGFLNGKVDQRQLVVSSINSHICFPNSTLVSVSTEKSLQARPLHIIFMHISISQLLPFLWTGSMWLIHFKKKDTWVAKRWPWHPRKKKLSCYSWT